MEPQNLAMPLRDSIQKTVRREYRMHRAKLWLGYLRNRSALARMRIRARHRGRKFIVIALIEHFGDIVACEPVSRHIRQRNPEACIVWCVSPRYRELVEHNPHVDQVITVNCLSEWTRLRDSGAFDEVVDLHFRNRVCNQCEEPLHKTMGDAAVTTENYYDYGCLLEAYCRGAGLSALDETPRLYIPAPARERVRDLGLPGEYVAVHCLSNERQRDWQAAKWAELAAELRELGLSIVEVGLKSNMDGVRGDYVNLCGKLTLLETGEVIRGARLFIGVDSGPAHLANAVGTAGVILLGRYRAFDRYCPYSGGYGDGSNAELIYSDGAAADIPASRVMQAITHRLACKTEAAAGKSV